MATATTKTKKTKKATKKATKKEKAPLNGNGNGATATTNKALAIPPPNFQWAEFPIRGTTVYVQHKWGAKALAQMRAKQVAGSTSRKGQKKAPKNFQMLYQEAMHRTVDGDCGIPAGALFKAMVSACRMCGFKMTVARQALYVAADVESADPSDRGGLVRITKGKPAPFETAVRIQQTCDIRIRPLWEPGWQATVRVRFDADIFTLEDVANLLMRAGMQVGVGEGRPDTPSGGMGWGLFELVEQPQR